MIAKLMPRIPAKAYMATSLEMCHDSMQIIYTFCVLKGNHYAQTFRLTDNRLQIFQTKQIRPRAVKPDIGMRDHNGYSVICAIANALNQLALYLVRVLRQLP